MSDEKPTPRPPKPHMSWQPDPRFNPETGTFTPSPSVTLAGIAELLERVSRRPRPSPRDDTAGLSADLRAAADFAARLAGVLAEITEDEITRLRAAAQFYESKSLNHTADRLARLREFAATPTEEKADR